MPRLIFQDELAQASGGSPTWYIPSAVHRRRDRDWYWEYDLDGDFPNRALIHRGRLHKGSDGWDAYDRDCGTLRIEIRRWVGRCCTDDVFHRYISKDYSYNDGRASWNYSGWVNISHGYHAFYFQNEIDYQAFMVAWANLTTDTIEETRSDVTIPEGVQIRQGRF